MFSLSNETGWSSDCGGHTPPARRSRNWLSGWNIRCGFGLTAGLWALLSGIECRAGDPVADFHLEDVNSNSPRYGARVSPRDYLLRVSAFYFGTAGCSSCRDQFRYLCALSQELQATEPPVAIEILGINHVSQNAYNFLIPSQGSLPWLQDTAEESVWTRWGVGLRDLWILNSQNRMVSVVNLTTLNLALESNRAFLKQILLANAQLTDSDADGLPDDWELQYFSELRQAAHDDPDGDGADNQAEYAFGTLPNRAESIRGITWTRGTQQDHPVLSVTFRRRAGAALDYLVTTSSDLRTWNANSASVVSTSPLRQLYDGTGTAEVTLSLPCSSAPGQAAFLRIEALPRSKP
jgi:hypothetical protein